ncbi:MAG: hypothetical protein V1899_01360 [Planctomycetota bacterium]
MATYDMFLAMALTNAKREEATALTLTVEREKSRIEMLLPDNSNRTLHAPPGEILIKIIESLEQGRTTFSSNVYVAAIEDVQVQRGTDNLVARISRWRIEHR